MALGAAVAFGLLTLGAIASDSEVDREETEGATTSSEEETDEVEKISVDSPMEAEEEEEASPSDEKMSEVDESSTATTVVKGTASSGTTVSAGELARQKGLDRHTEAGMAEDLYAKELERQGYTVVDDGSSVFTPDDGVDKILERGSEELKVQVKHHGEEVGHRTLKRCADADIDVLATTNGVKDGVDPADYGIEVVTKEDMSLSSRAKLELDRTGRGIGLAKDAAKSATKGLLGRVWDGIKSVGKKVLNGLKSVSKKIFSGAKSMGGGIISAAKSAASWFVTLSLGKQILLGAGVLVAIGGAIYLVRRWLQDKESTQSTNHRATVA